MLLVVVKWAIPENTKQTGYTFLKTQLEFLSFLFYPWKFQTNQQGFTS